LLKECGTDEGSRVIEMVVVGGKGEANFGPAQLGKRKMLFAFFRVEQFEGEAQSVIERGKEQKDRKRSSQEKGQDDKATAGEKHLEMFR
jgi:hypothetical protein